MRKRRSTPKAKKNDLDPVWIPNIAKPIPGDTGVDGGLGTWWKSHDLDVFVKMPVVAPTMTFLQLFWGSDKVPAAHAFIGEHNQHLDYITLTVKSHWILPEYADPVYCRFTTPSNHISRTRPLRLRVKQTEPGGRDPNYEQEGHQGLNFDLPPDVKIDGVHPGNVGPGKGVNIVIHPYLHMSLFDTIRLAWGSQLIEYQIVKPSEVGDSVVITVDYQTIVKAGDDPMLRVAFQVKDAVDNYPDYYALWSAVELVNVSLGFELHDRPWLGIAGDPEFEIFLSMLGDNDQKVSMYPSRGDFELKDSVLLVFEGIDADNMSVFHTELWAVDRVGAAHAFWIPNAIVRAVGSGTATIFYEHEAWAGGKRLSQRLQVTVIGDRPTWAAPTVDEAPAGYLDPYAAQATVRFSAAPGWQADYDLTVVMATTGTQNPLQYRETRKVGTIPVDRAMVFVVPGYEVKRFKGHAVEVYYEVVVPGHPPPRQSERLPLLVGEYVGDMPAPIIEKAEGQWLNPVDVPGGALVALPVEDTKAGDTFILYWSASDDGVSGQFPLSVSVDGQTPETTVGLAYIAPNLGKTVTVYYTLARGNEDLRFSEIQTLFIGVLPLAIDQREMVLDGLTLKVPEWQPTGEDVVGNTGFREATGGTPPYSYSSSNPTVASVVDGKVTGEANGIAVIRVTDDKGVTVSFNVAVSNVYRLVIDETLMTGPAAVAWMNSIGGVNIYNGYVYSQLPTIYIVPPRTKEYWACILSSSYWYIAYLYIPITFWGGKSENTKMGAWCMVPT